MTTGNAAAENPPGKIYYGWYIVALSFITLAVLVPARFTFGIFQVPLIKEFGWSRGALSGAYALALGAYALSAPYFGSLLEKKGPRAIVPLGTVLVGGAMALGYFVSSLWHVYLLTGLIAGIGLALSGFAIQSAIVPRWFVRKRGRAVGIALAGIGVGVLVLSPIAERLISLLGWRHAYLIMGASMLLLVLPLNFFFLRNRPADVGQAPDGTPLAPGDRPAEESAEQKAAKGVRATFLTIKRNPSFWGLCLLVFFIGFNNNTILSQLQLYLVDARFGMAPAAVIFGMTGFIRMGGSIGGGWLGDRVGRGRGAAISALVVALGLTLLLLIPALGGTLLAGYLFAVVYGLGNGSMTACYSALAGDCFEGATYGTIIGFMEICYGFGGVIGPLFAGFMFDYTGSYFIPFSAIILFMIAAVFISLWLQKAASARLAATHE
ncbi:MAG: MFS transporter [bacterium]|nr:MFS transporter [bacterium]